MSCRKRTFRSNLSSSTKQILAKCLEPVALVVGLFEQTVAIGMFEQVEVFVLSGPVELVEPAVGIEFVGVVALPVLFGEVEQVADRLVELVEQIRLADQT